MNESIAKKPRSTRRVMIFLKVNVFPRRRRLLELACLPSTACPLASSFMSLKGNVVVLNTLQETIHVHNMLQEK
jgi:hypothetical protein